MTENITKIADLLLETLSNDAKVIEEELKDPLGFPTSTDKMANTQKTAPTTAAQTIKDQKAASRQRTKEAERKRRSAKLLLRTNPRKKNVAKLLIAAQDKVIADEKAKRGHLSIQQSQLKDDYDLYDENIGNELLEMAAEIDNDINLMEAAEMDAELNESIRKLIREKRYKKASAKSEQLESVLTEIDRDIDRYTKLINEYTEMSSGENGDKYKNKINDLKKKLTELQDRRRALSNDWHKQNTKMLENESEEFDISALASNAMSLSESVNKLIEELEGDMPEIVLDDTDRLIAQLLDITNSSADPAILAIRNSEEGKAFITKYRKARQENNRTRMMQLKIEFNKILGHYKKQA